MTTLELNIIIIKVVNDNAGGQVIYETNGEADPVEVKRIVKTLV